jgi:hypothetical protein
VSLAGMDAILGIDPANRLVDVQAGVVTADVDRAAAAYRLMYAADPASYRESTIGGNIATNAGGLRCVKYVTADSIAGLQVVLANGDVITTGGLSICPPSPMPETATGIPRYSSTRPIPGARDHGGRILDRVSDAALSLGERSPESMASAR